MQKSYRFAAALLMLVPALGLAQGKKPAPKKKSAPAATAPSNAAKSTRQLAIECGIDDNKPWVKKQYAWFAEPGHPWTDDTLRTQLLAAAGLPPLLVPPVQYGYEFWGQSFLSDTVGHPMAKHLGQLANTRGSKFPDKSSVGAAGMHAVFLLAHHDTAVARVILHRLMEAGPAESPAADVATLEDRMRIATGKKQLYGTQFVLDTARQVHLLMVEDSAHVDLRREDAGLPPLKTSLCLAKNLK